MYSKTRVKRSLSKRPKSGFQDQLSLDVGLQFCRMRQGEHSAILSTFIKLPFAIKIFVLSIFEWPFYTGFTVGPTRYFLQPSGLVWPIIWSKTRNTGFLARRYQSWPFSRILLPMARHTCLNVIFVVWMEWIRRKLLSLVLVRATRLHCGGAVAFWEVPRYGDVIRHSAEERPIKHTLIFLWKW